MPRYAVDLQCDSCAQARVYVEAETKEEAEEKAQKLDKKTINWDIVELDDNDMEVIDVFEKPLRDRKPPMIHEVPPPEGA